MSEAVPQRYADQVEAGDALPALSCAATNVQLFRFSAVTNNPHRIHFDKDYALSEGHDDVLVQAHLHGAFLTRFVMDWIGGMGRLRAIEWKNRARAIASDTLTCTGSVARRFVKDGCDLFELDLSERNQEGVLCATGKATISLPRRPQP